MSLDAATKSLLHFEGANNSTTFTDETGKVWTRRGASQPVISTGQFKFGAASGYFNGGGTLDTPDHADFTFGANEFTIDFWFNISSFGADGLWLFAHAYDALYTNLSIASWVGFAGDIGVKIGYGSGNVIYLNGAYLSISTWYHLAIVKSYYLDNIQFYVNGSLQDSADGLSLWGATQNDVSNKFVLGGSGEFGTGPMLNGYLDEFRVSNVARWITDFTPPARPYGSPSKQKIIMTGGE